MPINAHPEYLAAEKEYLAAYTLEEKIEKLKKMVSLAPSHKGGENLRAQLKTRLKKFQSELEKSKKSRKGGKAKDSIKKEEMQAVLVGYTNSGKSSLLKLLTNTSPKISQGGFAKFTTRSPAVGMMNLDSGVQVQLIEIPAIESEYYDRGLVNSSDTILILVTSVGQIEKIMHETEKAKGKQIIIFNKSDLLNENEKRKLSATLQSKKYNFVLFSAKSREGIEELKNKIFRSFGKIRVYTKEPGKETKKYRPVILNPGATVREVAEKILKGLSKSNGIRETRIWGPSSKFPGQVVGLKHRLKDLDTVEFKTR